MAVDAYAHCGQEKYLPVEALDAVMIAADVSSAVLCQHLGQFDNAYLASIVESDPRRFAGVALVDHLAPTWRADLEAVRTRGFRGLRVTTAVFAENPELLHAAASADLILVVYAPDGIGPLVRPLRELATDVPGTRLVVSHLGSPRVVDDQLVGGEELLELAVEPNAYVTLSGLAMFCAFPYDALADLTARVLAAFGPQRVMWGSNFPVGGEGPRDYRRELDAVLGEGRWGVDSGAAEAISETTARRLWFE